MRKSFSVPITESSQVGEARRLAATMTEQSRLNETERGRVALIVTELGNNLAKYADQGLLLLRTLDELAQGGIEIIALDKGPGIADVSQSMMDGYSTRGTPGTGLGAVQRLATRFDIYSRLGEGTVICARVQPQDAHQSLPIDTVEIGVVCLPIKGEEACGDAWGAFVSHSHALFMVADGLGHGILAAEASDAAIRIFAETVPSSPKRILEDAHVALRGTRGAVAAAAEIDFEQNRVSYAGIGNIAGSIVESERVQHMVSMNGTIGQTPHVVRQYEYLWPGEAILILSSDGLGTHWRFDKYPGLLAKPSSIIASVLYRDWYRGRDDVTVLVVRWKGN